jgi:hypothetical protein
LARAWVTLGNRSPHSFEDLLELLPKQFQLAYPVRHGIELPSDQRAKPRTESRARAPVESAHQRLELMKRQS